LVEEVATRSPTATRTYATTSRFTVFWITWEQAKRVIPDCDPMATTSIESAPSISNAA
jgi:hypothetical protein